jgi:DNA-binding YbaB/EbfC family protein
MGIKDFSSMMKQAQELQGRMQEMQSEMDQMECTGASGAGLVSVTLNGKGDMKGLKIDESLLKPGEGEILEDLIVAAHNDAKAKMEAMLQDKMKSLTGGLPIPPGMKLF